VSVLSLSYTNKHFSELAPHHGGKQLVKWYADITSLSSYV